MASKQLEQEAEEGEVRKKSPHKKGWGPKLWLHDSFPLDRKAVHDISCLLVPVLQLPVLRHFSLARLETWSLK